MLPQKFVAELLVSRDGLQLFVCFPDLNGNAANLSFQALDVLLLSPDNFGLLFPIFH